MRHAIYTLDRTAARALTLAFAVALGLLVGCGDDEPTAPDPVPAAVAALSDRPGRGRLAPSRASRRSRRRRRAPRRTT